MGYLRSKKISSLDRAKFTLPLDDNLHTEIRKFVNEQNSTLTMMFNEIVEDYNKEMREKNGKEERKV